MRKIFYVFGTIDNKMVRSAVLFISRIKKQASVDTERLVFIRIRSDGGDSGSMTLIANEFLNLHKEYNYDVITQGIHCGSCALELFLSGTIRQITPKTTGYIHLPESKSLNVSKEQEFDAKNSSVSFIERRTLLSRDEIVLMERTPLVAPFFISKKLADEQVEEFFPN